MSIWSYNDSRAGPHVLEEAFNQQETCIFCAGGMHLLAGGRYSDELSVCPSRGWWSAFGSRQIGYEESEYAAIAGVIGRLANFTSKDQATPLADIRQYLVARY